MRYCGATSCEKVIDRIYRLTDCLSDWWEIKESEQNIAKYVKRYWLRCQGKLDSSNSISKNLDSHGICDLCHAEGYFVDIALHATWFQAFQGLSASLPAEKNETSFIVHSVLTTVT